MTPMPPTVTIPGLRSQTVTIKGVRLHHWIGGDPRGQPVMLWHGFLSTSYSWRQVAPALAQAGLAVLVPDMRGYGDSDKPDGTEGYDARALAEEARALVAELAFGAGRPVIHVAHDMGAPPALLWCADHPEEVSGLLYVEAPVMLGDVLRRIIAYTPEAMQQGSMWWWILPLAPGVPQRLVVGHERGFLTWFYENEAARPETIGPAVADEYLRTFSGREGVLGAMGVYRAAFTSIGQTERLAKSKVAVPAVAIGGARSLGPKVGEMLALVAHHVDAETLPDCGHFVPEERPDAVIRHVLAMAEKLA